MTSNFSSATPADSFFSPPPHHMELNPRQGHPPMHNSFAGLEQLPVPQGIKILPPELSQSYWQHLQQLQGGAPGPSHWPIDPLNMPDIHIIQQPPPTNSWVKDFDGQTVYVGRGKVEELDSEGNPVNPKTPRSLEMLSTSVTPPPAPRMNHKPLEPGSAGWGLGWGGTWGGDRSALPPDAQAFSLLKPPLSPVDSNISTPWNTSQLQTMAASGFLYPHEPNLQEANERLSDHMLRSTGYVPASHSAWPQRPLGGRSENGNPMSPSTPPGIRRPRREHPLRASFTFSELGSEFGGLLGEKSRLPDPLISPATQNQRLQDLLTDSVRPPESMRQTRDRDYDENNTRQTSSSVHPQPRVGPFDQQRMPSLHPPSPSDASTELLETADVPPIPAVPPVSQSPRLSTQPSNTGRGSFATDHFPLSSTPPPRHRQRTLGRATPWPAPSRRRTDPAVPPARPPPPPPAPSVPPPPGQHEAELLARISWWMGVGLTGMDSLRIASLKVDVDVHLADVCLVFHACWSSLQRSSPHRHLLPDKNIHLCTSNHFAETRSIHSGTHGAMYGGLANEIRGTSGFDAKVPRNLCGVCDVLTYILPKKQNPTKVVRVRF